MADDCDNVINFLWAGCAYHTIVFKIRNKDINVECSFDFIMKIATVCDMKRLKMYKWIKFGWQMTVIMLFIFYKPVARMIDLYYLMICQKSSSNLLPNR